jgi:hypothetical protein
MPDPVAARQNENVLLPLFAEYPVFRCISQNLSPAGRFLQSTMRRFNTSERSLSDWTHGALKEIIIR